MVKSKNDKCFVRGIKYRRFQHSVFERDDGKCVFCGSTENLTLDHIIPKSEVPELFWDINNARTLCDKCRVKNDLEQSRWK